MQVGFVGMGKLGLPVAVCLARRHAVIGYDINPALRKYRLYEHREAGPDGTGEFQPHFDAVYPMISMFFESGKSLVFAAEIADAIKGSEIIFVAAQTPHDPRFGGDSPLPPDRADFDYRYLVQAVKDVCEHTTPEQVVVIISTVLPGTVRREVLPYIDIGARHQIVYSPLFIAMGTVMRDFLDPEFVLLGGDDPEVVKKVRDFYWDFYTGSRPDLRPGVSPPILSMSIESAELAKVAYNTALTMKIHVANTLMEVCHQVPGCNIDDVANVLKAAHRRIVSTAYMEGGAEDGGGCLTGGTKIPLLDGREIPIRELVRLKEAYVYSYDIEAQRIVPGRAHSFRRTKRNARIYEVLLDNGRKIRCTGDHPFLLRSGEYVDARDLRAGNRLMPLYRKEKDGYERTYHPISGGWEATHRIVYRWKFGVDSGSGKHCHHADLDKRNNDPSNIESLGHTEHMRLHNELPARRQQQSKLMRRLNREGRINSPEHRETTRQRNLTDNPSWDPEARRKNAEANRRTQRKKVADGTHHLVTDNPTPRRVAEGVHNFITDHPMKDPAKKARMIENLNEFNAKRLGFSSHSESVKIIRRMRFTEGHTVDHIMRELNVTRGFVYRRLKDGCNHTVESVRCIGRADVYNFEVDEHHNYATAAGVFVHNCHPRDNIAMSWLASKLGLYYDTFGEAMKARQWRTEWVADILCREMDRTGLPLCILGKAYKPETNLVAGSWALLLAATLKRRGVLFDHYDPYVDDMGLVWDSPRVVMVATRHDAFRHYRFGRGCSVIDPFRYIPPQEGVTLIPLGIGPKPESYS